LHVIIIQSRIRRRRQTNDGDGGGGDYGDDADDDYIAIIVTRIVPDVQSTVDTTYFIISHGQDPDWSVLLGPIKNPCLIREAQGLCLPFVKLLGQLKQMI